MNTSQLHAKADKLARRLGISHAAACSALGKRAAARRRPRQPSKNDKPHDNVTFWWQRDDL